MVALCLDDGFWGRMVNVAFLPAIIIFMLFSVHFGITQIVCALGPVAHMQVHIQQCGSRPSLVRRPTAAALLSSCHENRGFY